MLVNADKFPQIMRIREFLEVVQKYPNAIYVIEDKDDSNMYGILSYPGMSHYNFETYMPYINGIHVTEGAEEGDVAGLVFHQHLSIQGKDDEYFKGYSRTKSEVDQIAGGMKSRYTSAGAKSETILSGADQFNPDGFVFAFSYKPIVGYEIPEDVVSVYVGNQGYGDRFRVDPGQIIVFKTGEKFDIRLPWEKYDDQGNLIEESKDLKHLKRFNKF